MRESRLELLSGSLPPDLWQLRRVHLSEELGRPFEAALEIVVAEEGGLADDILDELLRAPAMVRYGREGELELHGIVRAIEMDSTYEPTAATYHLRLVPRMWELSQIRRSRIFQEATVVDIVTEVLEGIGLGPSNQAVDWRVAKTYPTREYTVQYEETDLDFVQRLLEHHGIYYLFEHAPDGECVVFVDDKAALVQLQGHETIEYAATSTPDNPRVTALTRAYTPQPAAVLVRDYNWRTPSVPLQADAAADEVTGRGFSYRYGEHYKNPGEGAAIATLRAEQLMCQRDVYQGRCRVAALRPGHIFELIGHPFGDFDKRYTVTAIEMMADRDSEADAELSHETTFTAIPAEVQFRPALQTRKPTLLGVMHARVDGAVPGTAAPIDEWGRYKILFPFDMVGEPGGAASRWVRLAQPASGAGYGIHFPLHIGAEVAVSHLDGDPDRPIIMNSPPNTETVTPVNSANPTQSAIRTQAGIQMVWDDDC